MPAIPKDFSYIPDPDSPPFILSEDYKQLFYNAENRYKYEWDNGKNERTAKTTVKIGTNRVIFILIEGYELRVECVLRHFLL